MMTSAACAGPSIHFPDFCTRRSLLAQQQLDLSSTTTPMRDNPTHMVIDQEVDDDGVNEEGPLPSNLAAEATGLIAQASNLIAKATNLCAKASNVSAEAAGIAPEAEKATPPVARAAASSSRRNVGLSDFEKLSKIGYGGFGEVMLVKKNAGRDAGKYFALKMMSKEKILKKGKTDIRHANQERAALSELEHPFINRLHYAFHTKKYLYLVVTLCQGGELFNYLKMQEYEVISEHDARFYAAEVTLALGYMHSENVTFRDLKPENIFIMADGHIQLGDFGLCKKEDPANPNRKNTFCGTKYYIAPEVWFHSKCDSAVDWWSLGVLLYDMVHGGTPFQGAPGEPDEVIKKRIKNTGRIHFDRTLSSNFIGIVNGLLKKQACHRLGHGPNGVEAVKRNSFFDRINWTDVLNKQVLPPFVPALSGPEDVRYFDPDVVRSARNDNSDAASLSTSTNEFPGFSYNGSSDFSVSDSARSPPFQNLRNLGDVARLRARHHPSDASESEHLDRTDGPDSVPMAESNQGTAPESTSPVDYFLPQPLSMEAMPQSESMLASSVEAVSTAGEDSKKSKRKKPSRAQRRARKAVAEAGKVLPNAASLSVPSMANLTLGHVAPAQPSASDPGQGHPGPGQGASNHHMLSSDLLNSSDFPARPYGVPENELSARRDVSFPNRLSDLACASEVAGTETSRPGEPTTWYQNGQLVPGPAATFAATATNVARVAVDDADEDDDKAGWEDVSSRRHRNDRRRRELRNGRLDHEARAFRSPISPAFPREHYDPDELADHYGDAMDTETFPAAIPRTSAGSNVVRSTPINIGNHGNRSGNRRNRRH